MFNFFNVAKDKKEMGVEQESSAITDKYEQDTNERKKETPVHGEDGVCCGGCGGS
jgi:CCGSCS motif protein